MTLLSQLTLEEKAALCLGSTFWHTAPIPRLGIPAIMVADGPHGMRRQPDANQAGISGSLSATCFPTASALGSSWDRDLVRRVGEAIGVEARAQGGVQSQGVGACVKHFAANNQETDRLRVSADIDERTLREIYLPHFERIVTRARPWMVMCAYNRVNGIHASQNPWLLTEVLRDEWGFEGVVVSDWGAVHDRVAALAAGLDLEMPPNLGASDAALARDVAADSGLPPATSPRAPTASTSTCPPPRRRWWKASSSATAATTPSDARSLTPSGTACPTPPSTTRTSPSWPAAAPPRSNSTNATCRTGRPPTGLDKATAALPAR